MSSRLRFALCSASFFTQIAAAADLARVERHGVHVAGTTNGDGFMQFRTEQNPIQNGHTADIPLPDVLTVSPADGRVADSDQIFTIVKFKEGRCSVSDFPLMIGTLLVVAMCCMGVENSTVCCVAGVLAAPCAIAADLYIHATHHFYFLKWPNSAMIVLLAAALFFFQGVFRTSEWPLVPHRSIQFSGGWCGLLGLLSTGLLYALWFVHGAQSMADPSSLAVHKMLNCMHMVSVGIALANSFYVSLALRHWRFSNLIFLAQLLLLGLNTPDRMPLFLQRMWPSMYDHSFALFSVMVSLYVLWCPPLRVATVPDPPEDSCRPEGFHFHFERLQQMCAALSILYLISLIMDHSGSYPIWRQILYHESWAFLRPCYSALFAIYWLKRLPSAIFPQALICGLGTFYFISFSRLVETPASFRYGTTFEPPGTETVSMLGRSSHHVEGLLFNVSFFVFFLHSTCSGALHQQLEKNISAIAAAVFALAFLARFFMVKCVLYFLLIYLIPYLSVIVLAECNLNRVCGLKPCLISVEVESPMSGAKAVLATCKT